MMPVVRISDLTWERLKQHARPLEDSAEDVIRMALDALDEKAGKVPPPQPKIAQSISSAAKLPQKEFRAPLMQVLKELGGGGHVSEIRKRLEPKLKGRLLEGDYELVTSGEVRWWNAACWERNDLAKEGLVKRGSPRGVWELSSKGLELLAGRSA